MLALFLRMAACALAALCVYRCIRIAELRIRLMARQRQSLDLEDILRDRFLCTLLLCAAGVVVSYATTPWILLPSLAFAAVFSKRVPGMLDERAQSERRSACDEQLDVMADIVAMSVRSGLSFDAAIALYCSKFDNELARSLEKARLQWTSGLASRAQALNDLARELNSKAFKRFAETSVQAIHHGSPLADMLERFSEDIRQRRKSAVERQIAKAPIKMLIPMGTCILPAMLILVMGPVLLQFMQTGL